MIQTWSGIGHSFKGLQIRLSEAHFCLSMLALMAGIYGNPVINYRGMINSFDCTQNALIEKLSGKIGFLHAFDESTGAKALDSCIDRTIYQISAGESKARCGTDGKLRPTKQWTGVIAMTGEVTLLEEDVCEGAEVRIFELDNMQYTTSAEHSDRLKAAAADTWGTALYPMIEHLLGISKEDLHFYA